MNRLLLAVMAVGLWTPTASAQPPEGTKVPESFKSYEDGKHRRYELLFAVNGGAFAIAKLFADKNSARVLGSLSLCHLSVGMIVFTAVMGADITAVNTIMPTDR